MVLTTAPRKVLTVVVSLWLALAVLSALGQVYKYVLDGNDTVSRSAFNAEASIAAMFHSLLLLTCAVLLALIAADRRAAGSRYRFHWAVLAAAFLFLALDESTEIHELTVIPLRNALDAGGIFYFAWVIPAAAAVAVMGLAYLRFLAVLPRPTSVVFVLAAAFYLAGALGVELVGGYVADARGQDNLAFALITQVEEALESVGLIAFLYALLSYVTSHVGTVSVRLERSSRAATAGESRVSASRKARPTATRARSLTRSNA